MENTSGMEVFIRILSFQRTGITVATVKNELMRNALDKFLSSNDNKVTDSDDINLHSIRLFPWCSYDFNIRMHCSDTDRAALKESSGLRNYPNGYYCYEMWWWAECHLSELGKGNKYDLKVQIGTSHTLRFTLQFLKLQGFPREPGLCNSAIFWRREEVNIKIWEL